MLQVYEINFEFKAVTVNSGTNLEAVIWAPSLLFVTFARVFPRPMS